MATRRVAATVSDNGITISIELVRDDLAVPEMWQLLGQMLADIDQASQEGHDDER